MPKFEHVLLAGILAGCVVSNAWADEFDTFNLFLSAGAQHDSNLFRQSANERSDTIQSTAIGFTLNKALAQQRFSLQATMLDYRYSRHDYLDYQAFNYNAAWNWTLTPRLTGVLSFNQTELQNSFVDYSTGNAQTRPNVRQTRVNHFGAEWQATGGWRVIGGVTNNQQSNSDTFQAQAGYTLNTWELGGKYLWTSGTWAQLLRRQGNGEYAERQLVPLSILPAPFNSQLDTEFKQTETEFKFFVPLTAKTSVSSTLAHLAREHRHFPARDYSANVGRLDLQWQPTGHILVSGGLRREVASYQDYLSSYYVADGVNLTPTWQISNKVSARLRYDWQRRKFDGELVSGFADRRDTLQSLGVNFNWSPTRWANVTAGWQRDTRYSNTDNRDFKANVFSVNANFTF